MTDRLTIAHAIEEAGIERDKAEAIANTVMAAIRENAATKPELATMRYDLITRGIGALGVVILFLAAISALFDWLAAHHH